MKGSLVLKIRLKDPFYETDVHGFISLLLINGYTVTTKQVSDKLYIDYEINTES